MLASILRWWPVAACFAIAGIGMSGIVASVDPREEKRRRYYAANADYYRWRHKENDAVFMTQREFEELKPQYSRKDAAE